MKFWKKVLIGLVALILLFIGLLLLEVRSLTVEKLMMICLLFEGWAAIPRYSRPTPVQWWSTA